MVDDALPQVCALALPSSQEPCVRCPSARNPVRMEEAAQHPMCALVRTAMKGTTVECVSTVVKFNTLTFRMHMY